MKKMLENKTLAIHHNRKINYNYPYIHSKKSKNYEKIKNKNQQGCVQKDMGWIDSLSR